MLENEKDITKKREKKEKKEPNWIALYVDIYRCSVLIVLILSVSGIGGFVPGFSFYLFIWFYLFVLILLLSDGLLDSNCDSALAGSTLFLLVNKWTRNVCAVSPHTLLRKCFCFVFFRFFSSSKSGPRRRIEFMEKHERKKLVAGKQKQTKLHVWW